MERKDLCKAPYDLYRTQVDLPGARYYWEVTTIDLKKFYERFPLEPKPAEIFHASTQDPFETVVYRVARDGEPKSAQRSEEAQASFLKNLYFHQSYQSFEEAQFGHEELVYSIITGQLFLQDMLTLDDQMSDFAFRPDCGEEYGPHFLAPPHPYLLDLDDDFLVFEDWEEEED